MAGIRTLLTGMAALLVGCSQSGVGPGADHGNDSPNLVVIPGSSRLQVSNASDHPYRIRGLPDFDPPIPQPLGGVLTIATVPPGTTCLKLPAEIDIIATNVNTAQADTIRWLDSATIDFNLFDPNSGSMTASTDPVAPAESPGWALEIASDGSATLGPAEACTPQ